MRQILEVRQLHGLRVENLVNTIHLRMINRIWKRQRISWVISCGKRTDAALCISSNCDCRVVMLAASVHTCPPPS